MSISFDKKYLKRLSDELNKYTIDEIRIVKLHDCHREWQYYQKGALIYTETLFGPEPQTISFPDLNMKPGFTIGNG